MSGMACFSVCSITPSISSKLTRSTGSASVRNITELVVVNVLKYVEMGSIWDNMVVMTVTRLTETAVLPPALWRSIIDVSMEAFPHLLAANTLALLSHLPSVKSRDMNNSIRDFFTSQSILPSSI